MIKNSTQILRSPSYYKNQMPFPFNPSMSISYDASKLVSMSSNKVAYSKNNVDQDKISTSSPGTTLSGKIAQEKNLENISLNEKFKEIEIESYTNSSK